MKKLIPVIGATLAMAVAAQAQGTLYLNNFDADGSTSSASGNSAIWQGALGTSASLSTLVSILVGATSGSEVALASATLSGNPTAFQANNIGGAFSPTQGNYYDGGYGVVSGVGAGGTAFIEEEAWSGAATYALALTTAGAWHGITAEWSQAIGSTVPAVGAPSPATLNLPTDLIMTQTPVPEPTSLALAGLGGLASLMVLRRKKA